MGTRASCDCDQAMGGTKSAAAWHVLRGNTQAGCQVRLCQQQRSVRAAGKGAGGDWEAASAHSVKDRQPACVTPVHTVSTSHVWGGACLRRFRHPGLCGAASGATCLLLACCGLVCCSKR